MKKVAAKPRNTSSQQISVSSRSTWSYRWSWVRKWVTGNKKSRIQSLQGIIRTTVTTSKLKATPRSNYEGKKGIVAPGISSWEFTDGATWKDIFFDTGNTCRYFSCVYFRNIHLLQVKHKSYATEACVLINQLYNSFYFRFEAKYWVTKLFISNSTIDLLSVFSPHDLDLHPQGNLEEHLLMDIGWQENLSHPNTRYLL